MKHMGQDERRRIDSDKRRGYSNRHCALFDECRRTAFNGSRNVQRKSAPGCFESYPDYIEAGCPHLNRAPHVCNDCGRERNCPLEKRYYIASAAHANYAGTLANSRTGVHPDDETIRKMDEARSPSVRKGQSVDAVMANNPGLFAPYVRSTVYGWISDGLFSARKHDLPYAGTRRRKHGKPVPKTNARCRVGRTYAEFYCAPCRSSQKQHVERFHLELRRILQKGASFNSLDQDRINLVTSHLDSYPRESLDGATPYDAFVAKLGIVRIPADKVTLHPFLLGQRFQRAADRAILRKNGVTDTK